MVCLPKRSTTCELLDDRVPNDSHYCMSDCVSLRLWPRLMASQRRETKRWRDFRHCSLCLSLSLTVACSAHASAGDTTLGDIWRPRVELAHLFASKTPTSDPHETKPETLSQKPETRNEKRESSRRVRAAFSPNPRASPKRTRPAEVDEHCNERLEEPTTRADSTLAAAHIWRRFVRHSSQFARARG